MATVRVTEGFEPLPAGMYSATITAVSKVESTFDPASGALRWEFTISDGEHAGYDLWQFSSARLGPKTKARKWLRQLGVELVAGQEFDFDELVGVPVRLLVSADVREDGDIANAVVEMQRVTMNPAPTPTATVGAVAVDNLPF